MSIIKLLDEISSENLTKKTASRREMFGALGSFGKKAALAAVPFGLASTGSAKAASFFQETMTAVDSLQLALTLEYLEAEFYMMALESGVLAADSKAEAVFQIISDHETDHVNFLISALEGAGVEPVTKPTFDYTVGGMFDPFMMGTNTTQETAMTQLLLLAQAMEDTGVRAYKGQATNLMGTPYLQPALRIHSVEARHASQIRRLRGEMGWITLANPMSALPTDVETLVYGGEAEVVQAGIDLTTVDYGDSALIGDVREAVTEAFDEPIDAERARTIAGLFIVDSE